MNFALPYLPGHWSHDRLLARHGLPAISFLMGAATNSLNLLCISSPSNRWGSPVVKSAAISIIGGKGHSHPCSCAVNSKEDMTGQKIMGPIAVGNGLLYMPMAGTVIQP